MSVELREIRIRINSIRQISQVTSALQRVAAARLTRSRRAIEACQKYTTRLQDILNAIVLSDPDNLHPLMKGRKGKALLIIFGSERGLCGGFNSAILSALDEFIFDNEISSLIPIGKVMEHRISRMGFNVSASFSMPGISARENVVSRLLDLAVSHFQRPDGGPVFLLYTRFISMSRHLPVIEPLLPLSFAPEKLPAPMIPQPANIPFYAFEPSATSMTNRIIPEVLRQSLDNAFLNSIGSEDASRQEAMTRASSNADDMLTDLKLMFSRLRQEIITREIIEIAGGTAAVTADRKE